LRGRGFQANDGAGVPRAAEKRKTGGTKGKQMGLRIACDLDGTIADMEGALQREAERLFGADVVVRPPGSAHLEAPPEVGVDPASAAKKPEEPSGKRVLTPRQIRQLWEHVAGIENFWMTLNEIEPGSVARIAELRAKHALEVIFLTQRPDTAGDITQLQTQHWIAAHGFELPCAYVLRGSRGKAAAALDIDVVIDDRPENCLEVATESQARPILVWRDPVDTAPPGASRLGIETVFSVAEALQRVEEAILQPAKTKATFMARLRGVIGV